MKCSNYSIFSNESGHNLVIFVPLGVDIMKCCDVGLIYEGSRGN